MRLRLIPYREYPVAFNMALDWVLFQNALGGGSACVRFYGFDRTSVTLGKFQKRVPPSLASYPAARRPTGGRAVLHDHDLVMTLIAPHVSGLFSGSVLESYRKTAEIIAQAGRKMGLELELETGKPQAYQELCFDSTSRYEIKLHGKKAVGIAQFRDKGLFLEQGSLQLPAHRPGLIENIVQTMVEHGIELEEMPLEEWEMTRAREIEREFAIT